MYSYRTLALRLEGVPGVCPADPWVDVGVGGDPAGAGGGGHLDLSVLLPDEELGEGEEPVPEPLTIMFGERVFSSWLGGCGEGGRVGGGEGRACALVICLGAVPYSRALT